MATRTITYKAMDGKWYDKKIVDLIDSLDDSTEFTSKIREIWPIDRRMNYGWFVDNLSIACDIIDRLTGELNLERANADMRRK